MIPAVPPGTDPEAVCAACGAERITTAAVPCWLCGEALPALDGSPPPARPLGQAATQLAGQPGERILAPVLTGATVLLFLGVFLAAPGVAILLAVLATPVLIAVWSRAPTETYSSTGTATRATRSVAAILGIIIAAGVAGVVTFFAACWGGFFAGAAAGTVLGARNYEPLGWGMACAFTGGPLAGITVAILILRRLWKRPKNAG